VIGHGCVEWDVVDGNVRGAGGEIQKGGSGRRKEGDQGRLITTMRPAGLI
jgi:hypothetical protein